MTTHTSGCSDPAWFLFRQRSWFLSFDMNLSDRS